MALPEGVNRRYASIAGILLIIVWLWVAFDRPYSFPKHTAWSQYANVPVTSLDAAEGPTVVKDIFHDPEVDSDTIRNMCGGTQWNSSLVFKCENSAGTVGNVRNSILICVRRAIEVGANLILPRILNPDGTHQQGTTVLYWYTHPFGFMFDEGHFVNSLQQSCPDMKVYGSRKEVPFPDNYVHPPVISVESENIGMREGESWRSAFERLVSEMIRPDEDTFPIIIEMARPEPSYEIYNDGPGFVRDFGNILQFRPDVRDLANKSLLKLSSTYNLTLDLEDSTQLLPFFGAHLLTEEEKLGCTEGWPCIDRAFGLYSEESKGYLTQAQSSDHSVIYLSSHRDDEIAKFRKDAEEIGIKVHTKFDLLSRRDRVVLDKLTKDQQQLVDFLILLKASNFGGIGHSSFSWNVALKRHAMAEKTQFTIGSHIFEDSLSKLWGKMDKQPTLYHNMWP